VNLHKPNFTVTCQVQVLVCERTHDLVEARTALCVICNTLRDCCCHCVYRMWGWLSGELRLI
jgi:hypothetical protein